jgi:hypothetical protein
MTPRRGQLRQSGELDVLLQHATEIRELAAQVDAVIQSAAAPALTANRA